MRLKAGKKTRQVKGTDGKYTTVPIPNKPATVNRFSAVLSDMLQKAVDWKMLNRPDVPKIKMLNEENNRLNYLSVELARKLAGACNEVVRPIVITALKTGMRRGENLGLAWDRADLKHGFILMDKTKSGKRREVPIN
ncbi:MAG: site specific recombinase [Nitrospirae bacterium]|nr:MAG: site specific recombinase [Nitrospirota bacterium]